MSTFQHLSMLPFTTDMLNAVAKDLKMPHDIAVNMLATTLHDPDVDSTVHVGLCAKVSSGSCTIAEVLLGALHSYVGATADLRDMEVPDSPDEEDTFDPPLGSAVSFAAATKLVIPSDRPSMPPFPKGCVSMKQRQDFVDSFYASLKTASALSTTLTL